MESWSFRANDQWNGLSLLYVCILLVFLADLNAGRCHHVQLGRIDVYDPSHCQRDDLSFRGTTEVCGTRGSGEEREDVRHDVERTVDRRV